MSRRIILEDYDLPARCLPRDIKSLAHPLLCFTVIIDFPMNEQTLFSLIDHIFFYNTVREISAKPDWYEYNPDMVLSGEDGQSNALYAMQRLKGISAEEAVRTYFTRTGYEKFIGSLKEEEPRLKKVISDLISTDSALRYLSERLIMDLDNPGKMTGAWMMEDLIECELKGYDISVFSYFHHLYFTPKREHEPVFYLGQYHSPFRPLDIHGWYNKSKDRIVINSQALDGWVLFYEQSMHYLAEFKKANRLSALCIYKELRERLSVEALKAMMKELTLFHENTHRKDFNRPVKKHEKEMAGNADYRNEYLKEINHRPARAYPPWQELVAYEGVLDALLRDPLYKDKGFLELFKANILFTFNSETAHSVILTAYFTGLITHNDIKEIITRVLDNYHENKNILTEIRDGLSGKISFN